MTAAFQVPPTLEVIAPDEDMDLLSDASRMDHENDTFDFELTGSENPDQEVDYMLEDSAANQSTHVVAAADDDEMVDELEPPVDLNMEPEENSYNELSAQDELLDDASESHAEVDTADMDSDIDATELDQSNDNETIVDLEHPEYDFQSYNEVDSLEVTLQEASGEFKQGDGQIDQSFSMNADDTNAVGNPVLGDEDRDPQSPPAAAEATDDIESQLRETENSNDYPPEPQSSDEVQTVLEENAEHCVENLSAASKPADYSRDTNHEQPHTEELQLSTHETADRIAHVIEDGLKTPALTTQQPFDQGISSDTNDPAAVTEPTGEVNDNLADGLDIEIPTILVNYLDEEYSLFPPATSYASLAHYTDYTYLLNDVRLFQQNIRDLLSECRAVLGDVEDDLDLEMDVPGLGLTINEGQVECLDCSLEQIATIFHTLNANDGGEDMQPLQISLYVKPRFSVRLTALRQAVNEQRGLSELEFLNPPRDSPLIEEYKNDNVDDAGEAASQHDGPQPDGAEPIVDLKDPVSDHQSYANDKADQHLHNNDQLGEPFKPLELGTPAGQDHSGLAIFPHDDAKAIEAYDETWAPDNLARPASTHDFEEGDSSASSTLHGDGEAHAEDEFDLEAGDETVPGYDAHDETDPFDESLEDGVADENIGEDRLSDSNASLLAQNARTADMSIPAISAEDFNQTDAQASSYDQSHRHASPENDASIQQIPESAPPNWEQNGANVRNNKHTATDEGQYLAGYLEHSTEQHIYDSGAADVDDDITYEGEESYPHDRYESTDDNKTSMRNSSDTQGLESYHGHITGTKRSWAEDIFEDQSRSSVTSPKRARVDGSEA